MPQLTSLTLEFIRLDDENLAKMNQCFPSLQVLNLVGVGGLKQPEIRLSQLKVCHWTVSNFPCSLAIHAPHLTELKLQCVEPQILLLETPLLSHLDLKIRKPGLILNPEKIQNLKFIRLESFCVYSLAHVLQNKSVERMELDVPQPIEIENSFTIINLVCAFPNIHDLALGPGAWVKLENSFVNEWIDQRLEWWCLRKLMVRLPLDYDFAFLCFMLSLCVPFSEVILLIHGDVPIAVKNHVISRCKSNFPKIIWKWGMWRVT
ncbi:uncharacterized protein A4U43_C01F21210 [Asparagus officinalis]|uniref:FBD domain-containing protein n=2 Tax=Asparagus officinalis TaxID=4686 RepID=A0A5P1FRM3_ASPOF|nr:uncharacterized protein A4U43_C01F21210 [Asparagus officinalis]